MTPSEVLGAKTPETAATRFAEWVRKLCKELGNDPNNVFLWSPEETKQRGWGSGWAVCWEEGPFEWAVCTSLGSFLYAGEFGDYSKPGSFPEGLHGDGWFAEPYNNFVLNFYEA